MIDANKALEMRSNTNLYMHGKAILQAIPNNLQFYTVLSIRRVENAGVYGGNIRGERNEHQGTQGQWGIGISISQSCNITIEGTRSAECWGDGVYIGSDTYYKATSVNEVKYPVPENINLIDVTADHNRRQGITLVSGRNIDFIRPVLTNTGGFGDPEAGIDIEPDHNKHVIVGIYIEDAVTKNNAGAGIQLYLWHLEGGEPISIDINGHKDYGSLYGVLVAGKKGKPSGKVTIWKAKWEAARAQSLRINDHFANSYHIEVNNPYFLNGNGASHLSIVGPATKEGEALLGNVAIDSPRFNDTTRRENIPDTVVPIQLARDFMFETKDEDKKLVIKRPVFEGGYSEYTVPSYNKFAIEE